MFDVHEADSAMNSSNVSNANFRPTGSNSEASQGVSARPTGCFGSSVNRSLFAGFRSTANAGNAASGFPQGSSIQQREASATNPQISMQERRDIYKKNLIDIEGLLNKLVDVAYRVADIPLLARIVAEELVDIEQGNPAKIIEDLSFRNQQLKLGLESDFFDSSETVTAEFAAQTLKEFKTRLDKLLSKPHLEESIKGFSRGAAALQPECKTNRLALEDAINLPSAEDTVISTAKKLRKLIDSGHSSLAHILSMTSGSQEYQDLKKELDVCVQNILFMQGTKEATITEVQA